MEAQELPLITDIKSGEEITWCYDKVNCIMKKREIRQKSIKENCNFICACNQCKDGKEDIEALEAFEKLHEDAKQFKSTHEQMLMNHRSPAEIIPFLKKEIFCYKEMYNLGKKKKAAVSFLYIGVYLPWKIITINDHI